MCLLFGPHLHHVKQPLVGFRVCVDPEIAIFISLGDHELGIPVFGVFFIVVVHRNPQDQYVYFVLLDSSLVLSQKHKDWFDEIILSNQVHPEQRQAHFPSLNMSLIISKQAPRLCSEIGANKIGNLSHFVLYSGFIKAILYYILNASLRNYT